HPNEPLLGCAKDRRIVTAPAMRIAMGYLLVVEQRPSVPQQPDDDWVRLPHRLANQFLRQPPRCALRVKEAPRRVDRTIRRDAVLPPDDVVLHAMARGGVDGASSLLQRDVIGHYPE